MTVDDVLKAALNLAPADRELLIEQLLASLHGGGDFASDDLERAWLAELERRSQDIDAGTAELVDWSDVRQRIAQRRARG